MATKAVVIASGGMDSAVATYEAAFEHDGNIKVLSFDYGQRHKKELVQAALLCAGLDVPHHVVDITSVNKLLGGSALTDDVDVPEGRYDWDTMRSTVVPNRNSIMLNIAIGFAVAQKAPQVWVGVHAGDHFVYPDCRPAFIYGLEALARIANEGFIYPRFQIRAPFLYETKAHIVERGTRLRVPFEHTWTCYMGGDVACGRCGTCVERLEAFHIARVEDPLEYIDRYYWKTVCGVSDES